MKDPLRKCVIAATGDFGKDRTYEKIKRWVEVNGGKFSAKIDSKVTHLICSRDHFKRPVKMVQQALENRKIKIVNYDWLEDSLMAHSPKRPLDYLLRREVKAVERTKAKRRLVRKGNLKKGVEKFQKGCEDFKHQMHTDGYHVYHDATGFSYDVAFAQIDLMKNKNERYNLKVRYLPNPVFAVMSPRRCRIPFERPLTQRIQLYETHVAPFGYSCYANYSSPSAASATQILAPIGSTFELAMGSFGEFFKLKTKQDWNDRLAHMDLSNQGAFIYFPPELDQPQGIFREVE